MTNKEHKEENKCEECLAHNINETHVYPPWLKKLVAMKKEHKEQCECKELTCPKGCTRKHTHKRFFCETCEPVASFQMYPKAEEKCAEKIREALTCGKSVENGKAICGVKLDCHLHDWRQREQIENARLQERERLIEVAKKIKEKIQKEFYKVRKWF